MILALISPLLASLAVGPLLPGPSSETGPKGPHIVLFMIDDLGWRDLEPGAWTQLTEPQLNGAKEAEGQETSSARHFLTPHIARLAERSVRFADAYAAAPVCTPTRTSLMLGQSPARTGITYWTRHFDQDTSSPFPGEAPLLRAPAWRMNGIQPGEATLASRLRQAGYFTIHVGKAHFGTGPGGDPTELGFDVNVAGWAAGGPGSYLGIDAFSAAGREQRRGRTGPGDHSWDIPGLEAHHGKEVFLTDVLADEAEAAMRRSVADGERVFLHFAPYAVHAPLMVNERVRDRFPDLDGPELAYATLVASVDDAVGQILAAVDDLGIADTTLVVFTSDNGGLSAHGRGGKKHSHNLPLKSGKGSAYEGGVRVPLFVRWPGVTEAGRVARGPVVTQDLFRTLLAAAGGDARDAGATGLDLSPVLGGADVPETRPIVWHQPHYWGVAGPGIEPYSALRLGRWKLIYFHSSVVEESGVDGRPARAVRRPEPRFELYDLSVDIGEAHDLALDQPATVDALAELLSVELEAANAGMSIVLSTGEPVPLPRDLLAR
ncbi:Choline-sulfatase [Planctomycetes bacterium Poly30]|uniref:Choline-sulfatase n=1 Tax=Saltatorellus ferox TaxID=2528018 RepID=A0A518EUE3_9BACT|nr:Choline-sulfatase [Planctomycetes bacterium Poly30]